MKIVYYFEPWIELGRPSLRYHNLRYQIGPQIRNLKEKYQNLDITIVLGEGTYAQCQRDNFAVWGVPFKVISEASLRSIFSDYFSASMCLNSNNLTDDEMQKFFCLLESVIGGEAPDIIVSFLSPLYFLKEFWPDTLTLYAEFGIFSRVPFPRTFYLDPQGMFQFGYLRKFETELAALQPSVQQRELLASFRKAALNDGIKAHSPLQKHRSELSKFKYNVLLPLQFSRYFGFEGSCPFATQYDFLVYVLDHIDPDVGVVVTEHTSWDATITEHNEQYLTHKYPNLIIPKQYFQYTNMSQFLMAEVDAVVSVSSSVGLQAIFWDKPLIAVGDSHLNTFNSGTIDAVIEAIEHYPCGRFDGALCFLLERYYPTEQYFYNAEWAYNFYRNSLARYREDPNTSFDFYDVIDEVEPFYQNLIKSIRVDLFRRQNQRDEGNSLGMQRIAAIAQDRLQGKAAVLDNYDYISFDVFDTLIQRPFMMPHQLFLMMQDDVRGLLDDDTLKFHEFRRYAEHVCRTESEQDEVTLAEIYTTFVRLQNLDERYIELLIDLEKQYELQYCEPRPIGQEIYQLCKKLGKKIIVISDFYLDKAFVSEVLQKSGYSYNGFEEIFVSCEYRASKKSGALFDTVLNILKVPAHRILHIGDNWQSDIEHTEVRRINNMHTPKGSDIFFKNKTIAPIWGKEQKRAVYPTEALQKTTGACLGLFINKLYGNPEGRDKNSAFSGNAEDFGYCVFGPLFFGFIWDCIQQTKIHNIQNLMFLSRDGNIMHQCFNKMAEYLDDLPKAQYVLTSRRALSVAALENKADIWKALQIPFKPTTLHNILQSKFGLEVEEIPDCFLEYVGIGREEELHPVRDFIRIKEAVGYFAEEILDNALRERMAAEQYYAGFFGNKDESYALVDVGYTGTLQKYLRKLTGVSASCLFLMTHLKAKELAREGVLIKGFLGDFIDHTNELNLFNSHISLLEAVCSSSEDSLKKFILDEKYGVLAVTQVQGIVNDTRLETVMNIQTGILKFVDDFMSRFSDNLHHFDFNVDLIRKWFEYYVKAPSKNDAIIFNNVSHEDAYSGHTNRYIIADIVKSLRVNNNKLTKEKARHLVDISDWKNGARAILPARAEMPKAVPDVYEAIHFRVWQHHPQNLLETFREKSTFRVVDATDDKIFKSKRVPDRKSKLVRLINKFRYNRRQFFYDSKNPVIKLIYKLFYVK